MGNGAAGTLTNTVSVAAATGETDTNNNNNAAAANTPVDPRNGTITGFVYIDANQNGIRDAGETGIANTTITLTGTDALGNAVNRTGTTNANGQYSFTALAQGTYQVRETQPVGFRDGNEQLGTGATGAQAADDVFTTIGLAASGNAADFNFGELQLLLSKRRFLASSVAGVV